MSLKARIEAVIYAAEEPVTLPQLTAIFREEALASRAARLAPVADSEQPEAAATESTAGVDAVIAELVPAEADAEASLGAPGGVQPFRSAELGGSNREPGATSEEDAAESTESRMPEASDTTVPSDGNDGASSELNTAVPSESGAQNSSDAEVAVPDFAGEPQPFPNEPGEATTPGRENDPGLPPDEQRPDHAVEPSTNAVGADGERRRPDRSEDAEEAETPEHQADVEIAVSLPGTEPPPTAEDEKKLVRQREREAREEVRRLIDELIADYATADRGIEIREIAGGFRMATRAEYHDSVRAFVRSLKPPMKLSLQALETLAVIAYKQPVTAPEIGDIRGVDSGGVLGSLVARKLVTTAGRKQVVGRPILYKTTREFLLRFGLKDLNELPSIEEFEKMASELAETEEPGEQIPLAQNAIAAIEEQAEEAEEAESEEQAGAGSSLEVAQAMAAEGKVREEAEGPELVLPNAEPEVGAAASEPVEARDGQPDESAAAERDFGTETDTAADPDENPALAGAEENPEPKSVLAGSGHGDAVPAEESSSDGR